MSIFDAYDEEFNSLSRDIVKSTGELRNADSDGSDGICRQVEALLAQCNDLIKQMEVEVRGHDAPTRKALTEKVMQYKKSLLSLKSDYERVRDQNNKSSLVGTGKGAEQKQRLLNTNDKIGRQNEVIMNAQRTVAETEQVGLEISENLAQNREKIKSAHAKVHEFSGLTDSARRLVSSMSRREVQQRMVIGFIALVIIIAIGVTIYFVSKKK